MRVVIDDLRLFDGVEATYFRTLEAALEWWRRYRMEPEPVELWLDPDLGGLPDATSLTVRPLVSAIADYVETVGPLPLKVRIITDNPVGRQWMLDALGGRVPIVEGCPPWRIGVPDLSDRSARQK
jgi:hypothetical protein